MSALWRPNWLRNEPNPIAIPMPGKASDDSIVNQIEIVKASRRF
jgi:hypothetical protein